VEVWDPEKLRQEQLQDPNIANVLTSIETHRKPPWTELQSVRPALRALFQQYDSLVVVEGVLYRVFYDAGGSIKHYQLILLHSLKRDFLQLIHNDLCGHLCAKKCKPQVQQEAQLPQRNSASALQCMST